MVQNPVVPQIMTTSKSARGLREMILSISPNTPLTKALASGSMIGILKRLYDFSSSPRANIVLARTGITVTETMSDNNTDTEMATAISRNNCPACSCKINRGANTATVVKADAKMAPQTCDAPNNAERSDFSPFSRYW